MLQLAVNAESDFDLVAKRVQVNVGSSACGGPPQQVNRRRLRFTARHRRYAYFQPSDSSVTVFGVNAPMLNVAAGQFFVAVEVLVPSNDDT